MGTLILEPRSQLLLLGTFFHTTTSTFRLPAP